MEMPAPRNLSGAGSGGHDRLRNAHDKPLDTAFFAKKGNLQRSLKILQREARFLNTFSQHDPIII